MGHRIQIRGEGLNMKTTLYLKLLFTYIIFGLVSFISIASLGSCLAQNYVEDSTADRLYKEAAYIASNYTKQYEQNRITLRDLRDQLDAIDIYLNSSIWIMDRQGHILVQSEVSSLSDAPELIEEFDPTDMGHSYYCIGDFYGHFSSDVLTVLSPISSNMKTTGYVVIHTQTSNLIRERDRILNITYICFLVIYILSLMFLLFFHCFVYLPLQKINLAVQEYSSGNFSYRIPVESNDEIGTLAAALNYMAVGMGNADEYQKKFIANISHDFRSPLTSIKGYVEDILDGTIPPQLQEKYLNIVLFETDRLNKLTSGLLTLNSYDSKSSYLEKTDFDIQAVIKNTAAAFEGICTQKRISIELVFSGRTLYVHADMGKIQQVLYNLIDNAIKFSHHNSTIYVETTEKNEKVFVSVKDTGIGIPKDSIPKIWERFYKTDLSRGKDKKGSGLGLAITKEIIQAHNENINVISTEGIGTDFIFSLPKVMDYRPRSTENRQ